MLAISLVLLIRLWYYLVLSKVKGEDIMFVKKKTYESDINQLNYEIENLRGDLAKANGKASSLERSLEQEKNNNKALEQKVEELQAALDYKEEIYSSENSVTLKITDDLTQVVPTIKVKPEVFEKMVELGYLDDSVNSETKSVSMQAALLVIANEAMEQIIESMSNNIDNME